MGKMPGSIVRVEPSLLAVVNLLQKEMGIRQLSVERHFGILAEYGERALAGGADFLHVDIMDGVFVEQQTFGVSMEERVQWVHRLSERFGGEKLCVHVMISEENLNAYLDEFCRAKPAFFTFHYESAPKQLKEIYGIISRANAGPVNAGIALDREKDQAGPGTHPEVISEIIFYNDVYRVLLMSVKAGAGGQRFDPVALEHAKCIKNLNPDMCLQFDGGIDYKAQDGRECTAYQVGRALAHGDLGTNFILDLVAGTAIFKEEFKAENYAAPIKRIREAALEGMVVRNI